MAIYSRHILYPEILIPIVYSVYITAGNFHIFLSIVIFAYTAGIMKGGATHSPPSSMRPWLSPRRGIIAAAVGLEGAGGGLALQCHILFLF